MSTSFKVLYDGIGVYSDEALEQETFAVMLEKDSVHPGSYINDKVVKLNVDGTDGVYCSGINVEQTSGGQHAVADTVVIHADPNDLDDSPSPVSYSITLSIGITISLHTRIHSIFPEY